MKILIAPDSFKGSLSALEVAKNIEIGVLRVDPEAEIIKVPMADGGEGTVQSLVEASGGTVIYEEVVGPLGMPVTASYGILGDQRTAVIEMASASGLPLIPAGKSDPSKTTTYGTGQLIKAALDAGAEEIIIGIGGSATNDGGVGMAQALGIRFLDSQGQSIGYGGGELARLANIDISGLDPRIKRTKIEVACDVTNPLYGPEGAAYIYGPQKGADIDMIKRLDDNLRHFANIIKKHIDKDVKDIPGAGAAGGMGAGLLAFFDARLKPGIEIVIEINKLKEKLQGVDLVITGEGMLDGQTVKGKAPVGVAREAKRFGIPVIAIAGAIGEDADLVLKEGIDAFFGIIKKPTSIENAMKYTPEWLQQTGEQVIRIFKLSIGQKNRC
jgi:glycerate kinase